MPVFLFDQTADPCCKKMSSLNSLTAFSFVVGGGLLALVASPPGKWVYNGQSDFISTIAACGCVAHLIVMTDYFIWGCFSQFREDDLSPPEVKKIRYHFKLFSFTKLAYVAAADLVGAHTHTHAFSISIL